MKNQWNGKLMVSLTGDEKVDKLAIIVSCDGVDQLLVVPQLTNGTGQAISIGGQVNAKR